MSIALAGGLMMAAMPAAAQDVDGADTHWSFTITPRYQQLFFLPNYDAESLESLSSYGLSLAARSPNGRFGVMATVLRGRGSGVYTYDDDFFRGDYNYRVHRDEISIMGEYTPREANVTLLAGYHRFSALERETLIDPQPGNSESSRSRFSVDAAEIGIRLNSRLGANSRQSVSAQFSIGIGPGKYRSTFNEVFAGNTTNENISESGTGYVGDIALGYNIFVTNHLAVGVRGRANIYYVDADGSDPIFAIAPEVNLSYSF